MPEMLWSRRSTADEPGSKLYERQLRLTRGLLVGLLVVALNVIFVGPDALSIQGLVSLLGIAAVVAVALGLLKHVSRDT